MSKTHWAKHSFLGINIEFVGDGIVKINRNNYFREVKRTLKEKGTSL